MWTFPLAAGRWAAATAASVRFVQLAVNGTREAVPGLLEAIRQKKFNSPTPLGPYRLQWLAAFAIARRDPWPVVDAWLAENIHNQQTVLIDHDDAATIGATSAGLLLSRHDQKPAAFGLQSAADPQLTEMNISGYRYSAADGIQRIREWWKKQAK